MPQINNLSLADTYGRGIEDRKRNALLDQQNTLVGAQTQRQNALIGQEAAGAREQAVQRLGQVAGSILSTPPEGRRGMAMQVLQSPEFAPAFQALEIDPTQLASQGFDDASLEDALQALVSAGGGQNGQNASLPSELQTFNAMSRGLPEDDITRARRINLGLESRAGQLRVTDIGGVPTLVGAGPNGEPFSAPISSLSAEMQAEYGLKNAGAAGTEAAKNDAIPTRMLTEARTQAEIDAPARDQAIVASLDSIDNVLQMTSDAIGDVSWLTTGPVGVVMEKFAGTKAADLQATVDTIVANLSFDRLQQMRESSKTGGALGAISERELTLLGSAVAALRNSQSPQQQITNLRKVYEHYSSIRERMASQLSEKTVASNLPDGVTEEDISHTMQLHGLSREEVLQRIGNAP